MKTPIFKRALMATAIFMLLPFAPKAQTSQTTHFSQNFTLGDHNIVKEYDYPITIASGICGESGVSEFFYNVAGQTVRSSLVRMTNVYDFAIDNDTVFYCGVDNFDNAIIGFFDIQDLFFNGGQFYFSNNFSAYIEEDLYRSSMFNKLVTYRDTVGKRHVVCVGKARDNYSSVYPCIVDMISEPMLGFMSYNFGIVNDTTKSNTMMEIKRFCTASYPARTDTTRDYLPCDYLIVAGVDADQNLCLRFFNSMNPFATAGPQHTLYDFDVYDNIELRLRQFNETLIYPMSDHAIATCMAPYYSVNSQTRISSLYFSEINIFQVLSGVSTAMTRFAGADISDCGSVIKLDHFMYNTHTSRFAALMNGNSLGTGNRSSYFLEANYSLTAATNMLTGDDGVTSCGDRGFSGFDTYQSQLQYVLFGNCRNSGSYQYNVELETSGVASGCMPQDRADFIELTPPEVRGINSEVIIIGNRLNLGTIPAPVEIHEVESDCSY